MSGFETLLVVLGLLLLGRLIWAAFAVILAIQETEKRIQELRDEDEEL